MRVDIGTCRPEEFASLIAALDAEFVFGKGRRISLAQRFPSVLHAAHIHVLRRGGKIRSCVAVQSRELLAGETSWRLAMLGLVWTTPSERGRGHSSRLLASVADRLRERGVDMAVLWTGLEGFYERLGWRRHDSGCLGTVRNRRAAGGRRESFVTDLSPADPSFVEPLRQRCSTAHLPRSRADYRTLPLPAETVRLHPASSAGATRGYILYGLRGESVYVYEMLGDTESFGTLWSRLPEGAGSIFVNDAPGSTSHRWLGANVEVEWRLQRSAMWLPLSARAQGARFHTWHIPYFDRI
jgi:GNAT superfamily N-acetyltransferase